MTEEPTNDAGQALWQVCVEQLGQELPEQQFNTWIKPLTALVAEDFSKVTVYVANRFKLDWIRAQYAGRISAMLESLYGQPVTLELALAQRESVVRTYVRPPSATQQTAAQTLNVAVPTVTSEEASAPVFRTRLNPALTFETLVEGTANRMARSAAMHVAGSPGHLYNPLFIYGGVGLGKTHLVHAVGNQLLKDMGGLRSALQESGFIKLGVRKAYATTFEQLKARVMEADAKAHDMHGLFQNMFKQLNAEFAFTLQADPPPRMDDYLRQLAEIETGHAHYLGMGNLLKLSQPEFVDRLLRALVSRLRIVFEKAMNDIEQWSRSVASQIDTQLRERRRSFKRRMKTLERAESASSDLDGRIQEIQDALAANHAAEAELRRMIEELATFPVPAA